MAQKTTKRPKISTSSSDIDAKKPEENWLKRALKKIFSVKVIGTIIAAAALAATILIFYYQNRETKLDKLYLQFDCFTLGDKSEYNVDIILPQGEESILHVFDLHNQQEIGAKNIEARFFSDLEPFAIYPGEMIVESEIFSTKVGGKIKYSTIVPLKKFGTAILFNLGERQTGDKYDLSFEITGESKGRPIQVNTVNTIYQFSSLDQYRDYIASNNSNINNYWKSKDFIILNSNDIKPDGTYQLSYKFYKIEKIKGEYRLKECVPLR